MLFQDIASIKDKLQIKQPRHEKIQSDGLEALPAAISGADSPIEKSPPSTPAPRTRKRVGRKTRAHRNLGNIQDSSHQRKLSDNNVDMCKKKKNNVKQSDVSSTASTLTKISPKLTRSKKHCESHEALDTNSRELPSNSDNENVENGQEEDIQIKVEEGTGGENEPNQVDTKDKKILEGECLKTDAQTIQTEEKDVKDGIIMDKFQCRHCGRSYRNARNLDQHTAKQHTDKTDTYKCEVCEESFPLYKLYKMHRQKQHPQPQPTFSCSVCQKVFSRKANMQSHLECHVEEKQTKCLVCDKLFKGKMHLASHMYSKHSNTYSETHKPGPMLCQFCGKPFKTRRCLLAHLRCHTGQNALPCEICQAMFPNPSRLKRHMATIHATEPAYKCNICKKTFVYDISYQAHLNMHNDVRPFLCSSCGKGFRTNHHLKEHMNIHTRTRTFFCPLCGEKFLWRAQLLRHRKRLHTVATTHQQESLSCKDLEPTQSTVASDASHVNLQVQDEFLPAGVGPEIQGGVEKLPETLQNQDRDQLGAAIELVSSNADIAVQDAQPGPALTNTGQYHTIESFPKHTVVLQPMDVTDSLTLHQNPSIIPATSSYHNKTSSSQISGNTGQSITVVSSPTIDAQVPINQQIGFALPGEVTDTTVVSVSDDVTDVPPPSCALTYFTITPSTSLSQQVLRLNPATVMAEDNMYSMAPTVQQTIAVPQNSSMDTLETVTNQHQAFIHPLDENKANSTLTYQFTNSEQQHGPEVHAVMTFSTNAVQAETHLLRPSLDDQGDS